MVSIKTVKATLDTIPSSLPDNYTAVFLGATSGIGLSTLKHLTTATRGKSPRIYIVGRSAKAFDATLAELSNSNPSADFVFVEQDVSLVRNVKNVVEEVERSAKKVDLLFLSVGFISFDGRKETVEGLDASMSTRYYSRLRTTILLLPLLKLSPSAHVVNILAGGQEGPLLLDDLDLSQNPKNYSIARAATHCATMLTLSLEHLATANPSISFVHAFPGVTATPLLTRGSTGWTKCLLNHVAVPIMGLFAASSDDVGARSLLYATSARYTVPGRASLTAPLSEGEEILARSKGGVFLVDENSEAPKNEKVLDELRAQAAQKVWDHTMRIFEGLD